MGIEILHNLVDPQNKCNNGDNYFRAPAPLWIQEPHKQKR